MSSEAIETKQPKALYMLFFAEMWERFSFYGMRALLILYMVSQMLMDDDAAIGVYAAYGALVYATPFIGGMIADNYLGYRKSVIFGGILMTVGHFIMAFESDATFYGALALLILGNGFFKPNISSMVGNLYKENDPRRDGGFTIFYMGINLGAFLAPLVCGILGEGFGWHYGFGLAGVGMLLGLIVFWRGQNKLGENNGFPSNPEKLKEKVLGFISKEWLIYILTFLLVPAFALLVNHSHVAEWLNISIAAIALVSLLLLTIFKYNGVERKRLGVILVLIVFSTLFWAFFEQAGSSINLFTARNVDRGLFGTELPASIFQSVNPLFIIILAPMFASLWIRLKKKNREPSTPLKFSLGILQLGLGFFVLVFGIMQSGETGQSPLIYLLLGYLLHTTGELCLSPVGLSMVTKLSPAKIVSMTLGIWFISSSLAHIVGGVVAKETSTSAYKVQTVTYTPKIGQTESDAFVVQVSDKADSTGLTTENITINIDIVDEMPAEEAAKVGNYVQYVSIAPNTADTLNLRIPYLDPTGDRMDIQVDPSTLSGEAKVEGDLLIYKPTQAGEEKLTYTLCNKEAKDKCETVEVVITTDDVDNHAPVASVTEYNLKMPKRGYFSKFMGEATTGANILAGVVDKDGDALHIKIVEKAKLGMGKVEKSLHQNATPDKMINKYADVFLLIAYICMGAFVVLLILVPMLRKWMSGIH